MKPGPRWTSEPKSGSKAPESNPRSRKCFSLSTSRGASLGTNGRQESIPPCSPPAVQTCPRIRTCSPVRRGQTESTLPKSECRQTHLLGQLSTSERPMSRVRNPRWSPSACRGHATVHQGSMMHPLPRIISHGPDVPVPTPRCPPAPQIYAASSPNTSLASPSQRQPHCFVASPGFLAQSRSRSRMRFKWGRVALRPRRGDRLSDPNRCFPPPPAHKPLSPEPVLQPLSQPQEAATPPPPTPAT